MHSRDEEGEYNKKNIKNPIDAEYLRGFEYAIDRLREFNSVEWELCPETETILERIKREIAEEILNEAVESLEGWADEINITILEGQEDEINGDNEIND